MKKMIELTTDEKNFPAYVSRPTGEIKGGLIVIHEVWGLVDHTKDVADRFAMEGYVVVAPDLLSETGITAELAGQLQEELFDPERRNAAQPKIRELMAPMQAPGFGEATLKKVQSCFTYLDELDGVDGRIGITGFCFGGSYSFSLAVHEPRLRAAVPFYGHADFSVEELKSITCPILAFYGANDERLVGGLDKLKANMKAAGVDFSAKVYEDAGHAFFNDTNRFAYSAVAAKDAWEQTKRFLAANLA